MSNEPQTQTNDADTTTNAGDELELLKARAKMLGVNHSNNIGVESLRAKIAAKLESDETEDTEDEESEDGADVEETETTEDAPAAKEMAPMPAVTEKEPVQPVNALDPTNESTPKKNMTKAERRQMKIKEANRLVRVRIQCMDPKKKDLPGEILTVANEVVGTIRRFVPYGESTDNGTHVEYALYKLLESRRFLHITTKRDPRTGVTTPRSRYVKEFAIEVLPQLTQEELGRLANQQAASGSISDDSE